MPESGVERSREYDEYIDPKGYWIDPERAIRRMTEKDGKQAVIIQATPDCSDAEWERFYEAVVACLGGTKT